MEKERLIKDILLFDDTADEDLNNDYICADYISETFKDLEDLIDRTVEDLENIDIDNHDRCIGRG